MTSRASYRILVLTFNRDELKLEIPIKSGRSIFQQNFVCWNGLPLDIRKLTMDYRWDLVLIYHGSERFYVVQVIKFIFDNLSYMISSFLIKAVLFSTLYLKALCNFQVLSLAALSQLAVLLRSCLLNQAQDNAVFKNCFIIIIVGLLNSKVTRISDICYDS